MKLRQSFKANMLRKKCYFTFPICILFALKETQCRKYDIEQEARALYGENLKAVMERFRRTAEYLSILNDEVGEMYKRLQAVRVRTLQAFGLRLYDRVLLEVGGNQTHAGVARARYPASKFKTSHSGYGRRPGSFDDEDEMEMKELEELFKRPNNIMLRQSYVPRQNYKKSLTNVLDSYDKLNCPLTLAERNRVKEIGFEYARLALHAMIEYMSPEDAPPLSTMQPYGEPGEISHHHHHHEITEPGTKSTAHQENHSTNAKYLH